MSEFLEWMISVDDHVIEPPHVWQERLPARLRDVGPRVVRDDEGEAWMYEDRRMPTTGLVAAAGKRKEEFSMNPLTYDEMRPGCYDAKARVEDMNRDSVIASLCFPSFPRFCGQTFAEGKDKELGLLCVQAYNDWMIEEWAGSAPGRFIPCMIIPLWDPTLAAREIERTAGRGAKAFAFSENPAALGLPSIHSADGYWDPVISAANDTGLPICMHVGSSSNIPRTAPDAPLIISLAWSSGVLPSGALLDWLFSGHLQRYPNVKLCLSEGGIGWIPFFLERAEQVYDRQRYWASKMDFEFDPATGTLKPKAASSGSAALTKEFRMVDLFWDHVYGCFIEDFHGVANLDLIGVDNVMIETDYPHTDSSWPNSQALARKQLAGRTHEEIHKIMQGNARRVFNFEPAEPPPR